ncbi:hypothetical protein C8J57DRAFT_1234961 [Mycena rebaudengoi]|nr:hypothetical protein C8J57DRAFT_1234961 [Mycena rebaudengoi]
MKGQKKAHHAAGPIRTGSTLGVAYHPYRQEDPSGPGASPHYGQVPPEVLEGVPSDVVWYEVFRNEGYSEVKLRRLAEVLHTADAVDNFFEKKFPGMLSIDSRRDMFAGPNRTLALYHHNSAGKNAPIGDSELLVTACFLLLRQPSGSHDVRHAASVPSAPDHSISPRDFGSRQVKQIDGGSGQFKRQFKQCLNGPKSAFTPSGHLRPWGRVQSVELSALSSTGFKLGLNMLTSDGLNTAGSTGAML